MSCEMFIHVEFIHIYLLFSTIFLITIFVFGYIFSQDITIDSMVSSWCLCSLVAHALCKGLIWNHYNTTVNWSTNILILYQIQLYQVKSFILDTLQWRHNEGHGISNLQPHDCLLNRLFKAQIKETSKLGVTGLCEGNSPVTSEFPAQRASNAENVSIWWRHHEQWDSKAMIFTFDAFFDLHLNKRLSKQSWGWWFETLSRALWRQCNDMWVNCVIIESGNALLSVYNKPLHGPMRTYSSTSFLGIYFSKIRKRKVLQWFWSKCIWT